MAYAIDLSPRQTTRTLEQAVRHGAEALLVPRVRPDDEPIPCRLHRIVGPTEAPSSRACLIVVPGLIGGEARRGGAADGSGAGPAAASVGRCEELIGVYCDVTIYLGDNCYLFCSDVVGLAELSDPTAAVGICLARPEIIQVTQRRRLWRFRPERSAQVELSWTDPDRGNRQATGWLCNVSGGGLACRVDLRVADELGIGGPLTAEFALAPGEVDRFTLDAVLCSKTPAGTQGTMILGLQFATGPGHEPSMEAAEALRRQLLTRYTRSVDAPKGAES